MNSSQAVSRSHNRLAVPALFFLFYNMKYVMRSNSVLLILVAWLLTACAAKPPQFDGQAAFTHVEAQMKLGARPTGSPAWQQTGDYILSQLRKTGWATEEQRFDYRGVSVRNIIGRKGSGPVLILGAHYDTRLRADQDKINPAAPVPGANDGASGVAVLLELARTLDKSKLHNEVWLAFFDAEDNGDLDGWQWIVGSSNMAQHLQVKPEVVIVVDMIGDADQQIYYDRNSNAQWNQRIWAVAGQLGYSQYLIPQPKWAMFDDHTPFAQLGIPAVDIIDFDYPYWHTAADTADKVSPASLERVGRTLQALLEQSP
jgi:glutaminyl-peptide cyclotransferase